jgi:hypothetical protein
MSSLARCAFGIWAFSVLGSTVVGQESPALPDTPGLVGTVVLPDKNQKVPAAPQADPNAKAVVELRWVESRRIEGLTEDEGFQSSCDPDSIVYAHKEPALVLTSAVVTEARLTKHDFSTLGVNYMVTLPLTQEARDALAAMCEGKQMRLLTVVIDGRPWGLRRYEIDKDVPFVPESARAETFLPDVGFFSSEAEAQRVVDAVQ